jgi:ParB/RepB/Spo0J family partition protein
MTSTQRKRLEGAMSKLVGAANSTGKNSSHLSTVEINQPSKYIPVNQIRPSPYQPRLGIDQTHVAVLAESIRNSSLSNPIIVRMVEDGQYELIAGENRLAAVKLLGEEEILAIVRRVDDRTAWLLSVADNLARKDLSDYEQGLAFQKMVEAKLVASIKELSEHLGVNRTHIHSCLAFTSFPEGAHELLRMSPTLIGARLALELKEYCLDGQHELVLQAIHLINDKRLNQSGAVTWIQQRLNRTPNNSTKVDNHLKTIDSGKGRRVQIAKKESSSGLTFKLKFDREIITDAELEQAIYQALEKIC